MRKIKNLTVYLAFLLCVTLLFAGNPGFYTARSSLYLWDLGHVLLFTLASIIIIKNIPWFNRFSFKNQILIISGFSIFFGVVTELLQVNFHRTPDIYDLFRDLLGSLLGVAFYSVKRREAPVLFRKIVQAILIILTLISIYPFAAALSDEIIALAQFPLLSDFETPMEVNRWQNHSQLKLENGLARHGEKSLRVVLTTSKYSGVSLKYFPAKWQNYESFRFSIYNPDNDTLRVVCRINDAMHNHSYSDRYNKAFFIKNGWNDIEIKLADVQSAPKDRKMDMENIELISIFTVQSPIRRIIYLDHFYLTD